MLEDKMKSDLRSCSNQISVLHPYVHLKVCTYVHTHEHVIPHKQTWKEKLQNFHCLYYDSLEKQAYISSILLDIIINILHYIIKYSLPHILNMYYINMYILYKEDLIFGARFGLQANLTLFLYEIGISSLESFCHFSLAFK